MSKVNITILGAGIAGLGAIDKAARLGKSAVAFEAKSRAGGLLANFEIDGFRFDNAVHFSFTEIKEVRGIFDKVEYHKHKPDSYCLDRQYWLKHPIQNNLYSLPLDEKISLIKSFIERPDIEPENYSQWLEHQYGFELAATYPKRYTKKYWGLAAEKLSTTWIGNRMRRADITEVLKGSLEQRDDNHYYANEMRYPKKGGYFSFIKDLAKVDNIVFNKQATGIDIHAKTISFSDDSITTYNQLVSSLPLPMLCELINDCPETVLIASRSLLWTTVDLISIGFDKADIPPYLWFYIYDEDNLAARAYSPSWKSSDNVPKGKSSLQFEVYNLSSNEKLNPLELKKNIKTKLLEMAICSESDILFMEHKHLPYGNVVFDVGMEERRKVVLDYLSSVGIKSCGRFGEWDYFWSDQSFMSGFNQVS
ncbi:protoporphyrinogen/coproporphyrinogen oxidase [Shewanella oncorhynchi]|uniref:protoporphyrinogen/coproporphyrinogen oxidase n=1 Tax=Shewanella oncorhynchi TaxID=2726434 RepID=UPI003D7B4542